MGNWNFRSQELPLPGVKALESESSIIQDMLPTKLLMKSFNPTSITIICSMELPCSLPLLLGEDRLVSAVFNAS